MKIGKTPSVIVITPTIGKPELSNAIDSVLEQTYKNIIHLIVIDGEKYNDDTLKILSRFKSENLKVLLLPFNTGQNNFYGHRIYAACSYLVNEDLIFFLDEDNWYDANHVSSLVELITDEDLEWGYSLRKIYKYNKEFVANDNCESLGTWPPYSNLPNLVDTSCYAIRRETLIEVGGAWYYKWGGDRAFFHQLSNSFKNFETTSLYTLNYSLHKTNPPTPEFFIEGNKHMLEKYNSNLPWKDLSCQ